MSSVPDPRMTEGEYLAYDLTHEGRHEYYPPGALVSMSGASEAHVLISVNLAVALVTRLRGGPCRVYNGDMRVRVEATGAYVYPDVSIACDPPRFTESKPPSLLNPSIVIEVLSDTTEAHDRGAKAAHYRHLGGLSAYVFVATRERRIEVYARQEDGSWRLTEAEGEGTVAIPPHGLALSLSEVYEGVEVGRP
ncbi:MAG: Uma2 family endonuclease [Pseudomonadota bacterium]|nr:Uma2 family endonuclease [Pseudomonadota bacterium]